MSLIATELSYCMPSPLYPLLLLYEFALQQKIRNSNKTEVPCHGAKQNVLAPRVGSKFSMIVGYPLLGSGFNESKLALHNDDQPFQASIERTRINH